MFFYALDGDDVGRKLERLILEENLEEVSSLSKNITKMISEFEFYMKKNGASIIFCAGDGLMASSAEPIYVEQLPSFYKECSFSIGIGNTPSNALLALKKAKGLGKARTETHFTNAS